MAVEDKQMSYRIYLVAFGIFLMAMAVVFKLSRIQWVEGAHYRKLAAEQTVKDFVIPANKGNIYSSDGSLLATSIPNYTIRFDAVAPKQEDFDKNVKGLADSLSVMLGKPSSYYHSELRKAHANKNRYYLLAKGLSYTEYMRLKTFPLFNLGTYKGGMITEQKTVREHPIGKIAERTIGYERVKPNGELDGKGIEWSFRNYLNGKDGKVSKQKIAKGQWKPIRDVNEVDPQDGYDVISTIDVYIQDIAHHALLKQLELYEADHGCVVVMETQTGHVKAISNLGRAEDGSYYETVNYAVAESHEPGSTFKLVDLIALLDDNKVDTSQVYDSRGGEITYYGRKVRDSHKGGYGKISLARGFEVSSNTVLVQAVYENYKINPKEFVDRIDRMGLNKPLGLPFQGEGKPFIPQPGEKGWSGIALPWMAYGYGVSVTPLQTLALYNAIANNGEMVKPIFVSEIKEWNKTIKKYNKQVINPRICSQETVKKVKAVLENVVKKGTGSKLYSKDFSMAGKTGTAQVNYSRGKDEMYYASSFVGFFPSDKPKYSCIVVVHKPNTAKNNYYGADVAGPVFKRIAQKIFTDAPSTNEIKNLNKKINKQEVAYSVYNDKINSEKKVVPNLKGMAGMDAVALLENLKIKVKIIGTGKVKKQSIQPGEALEKVKTITLELS
ncbi:penicillin-binding protein [Flavobacterium dankookense]|uniref:Cell division protein FtsI (Penicillin-binding protein 3) n=1 Tax=Flavobacterium dankookense TaxID=706186 RepID=A0A4R6Q6V3_9FLAO|nr:penicillin-binding protein [Flavobacterium dankookense]TDP58228.1 cell division protein FtsI (penicillin-binding protein 3) [Flavobacterium dankookense]